MRGQPRWSRGAGGARKPASPGSEQLCRAGRQPGSWARTAWSPSCPQALGWAPASVARLRNHPLAGGRWARRGNAVRESKIPAFVRPPTLSQELFQHRQRWIPTGRHPGPQRTCPVLPCITEGTLTGMKPSSGLAGANSLGSPRAMWTRQWGACVGALSAATANPAARPQSGAVPTRVNCSRQLSGRWRGRP